MHNVHSFRLSLDSGRNLVVNSGVAHRRLTRRKDHSGSSCSRGGRESWCPKNFIQPLLGENLDPIPTPPARLLRHGRAAVTCRYTQVRPSPPFLSFPYWTILWSGACNECQYPGSMTFVGGSIADARGASPRSQPRCPWRLTMNLQAPLSCTHQY